MSEHKKKCCGGKCHTDFKKAGEKPVAPPAPPANESQKPEAPKKKCCGGGCHPKK